MRPACRRGDRTAKFVFVRLVERANTKTAVVFLEALLTALLEEFYSVLKDNGILFTDLPKHCNGFTALPCSDMCGPRAQVSPGQAQPSPPQSPNRVSSRDRIEGLLAFDEGPAKPSR